MHLTVGRGRCTTIVFDVKEYYNLIVKNSGINPTHDLGNLFEFEDRSVVVVSTTDLDGYEPCDPSVEGDQILMDPERGLQSKGGKSGSFSETFLHVASVPHPKQDCGGAAV